MSSSSQIHYAGHSPFIPFLEISYILSFRWPQSLMGRSLHHWLIIRSSGLHQNKNSRQDQFWIQEGRDAQSCASLHFPRTTSSTLIDPWLLLREVTCDSMAPQVLSKMASQRLRSWSNCRSLAYSTVIGICQNCYNPRTIRANGQLDSRTGLLRYGNV